MRVHFIIGRDGGDAQYRTARRWRQVGGIVRTWNDALADALATSSSPAGAARCSQRYRDAFSDGYRDAYPPADAVEDIAMIEACRRSGRSASTSIRVCEDGSVRRAEGLEPHAADPAVGARAGAGEYGLPRRRRAHAISGDGGRTANLVPRHDAGARRGGPMDLGEDSSGLKRYFSL